MQDDDDDDMVFTVPDRQRRLSIDVETLPLNEVDRVEAVNVDNGKATNSSKKSVRKVRGYSLGVQRWERAVSSEICLLKANRAWLIVACFDGTVNVLSTSTGLLLFKFILDSAPCSLTLENGYLSVITGYGFIYVWNLEDGSVVLSKKSCLDPFSQDDSLEKHLVTSTGVPVLHLSSGKTFAFTAGCWQILGDNRSILPQISNAIPEPTLCSDPNLLFLLYPSESEALHVDSATRISATCSLMEERINAACTFQCEKEFCTFMDYYVRWLIETDNQEKLKGLITSLKKQKVWFGSMNTTKALEMISAIQEQYERNKIV